MGVLAVSNEVLETLVCWAREGCGITFAVPQRFKQAAKEQGFSFYCPRGHCLSIGEGDVTKLQKELELERKRKEWAENESARLRVKLDTTERSRAAYKGQLSRVKNGVCPCCRRNFTNLRRHMEIKHPDYDPGREEGEK